MRRRRCAAFFHERQRRWRMPAGCTAGEAFRLGRSPGAGPHLLVAAHHAAAHAAAGHAATLQRPVHAIRTPHANSVLLHWCFVRRWDLRAATLTTPADGSNQPADRTNHGKALQPVQAAMMAAFWAHFSHLGHLEGHLADDVAGLGVRQLALLAAAAADLDLCASETAACQVADQRHDCHLGLKMQVQTCMALCGGVHAISIYHARRCSSGRSGADIWDCADTGTVYTPGPRPAPCRAAAACWPCPAPCSRTEDSVSLQRR